MSFLSVKQYARARMVGLGFVEWPDVSWRNIPQTRLNDVFHLEHSEARAVVQDHDSLHVEVPFSVRVFLSQGRDPKSLADEILETAYGVVADFVAAANRLTQSTMKNVQFESMTIEPLDDSNDNGIIAKISFTALVIISTQ
jgi:hypothetical protein